MIPLLRARGTLKYDRGIARAHDQYVLPSGQREPKYEGEGFVVRKLEEGVAVEFEHVSEDLRVFVQRLVGSAEA